MGSVVTGEGVAVNSVKMDVPRPIYEWLSGLRAEMTGEKKRTVTYPEVWEHVKAVYERMPEIPETAR